MLVEGSMGRYADRRDITEITLKAALNTVHSQDFLCLTLDSSSKSKRNIRYTDWAECLVYAGPTGISFSDMEKKITRFIFLTLVVPFETKALFCDKCRSRSTCTYVQSNLPLHSALLYR